MLLGIFWCLSVVLRMEAVCMLALSLSYTPSPTGTLIKCVYVFASSYVQVRMSVCTRVHVEVTGQPGVSSSGATPPFSSFNFLHLFTYLLSCMGTRVEVRIPSKASVGYPSTPF